MTSTQSDGMLAEMRSRIELAIDEIMEIQRHTPDDGNASLFIRCLHRLEQGLVGSTTLDADYKQASFALFRILTDSAGQENSLSGQIVGRLIGELYELEKDIV